MMDSLEVDATTIEAIKAYLTAAGGDATLAAAAMIANGLHQVAHALENAVAEQISCAIANHQEALAALAD